MIITLWIEDKLNFNVTCLNMSCKQIFARQFAGCVVCDSVVQNMMYMEEQRYEFGTQSEVP